MPPPTNEELDQRRQLIRQALARLDPQGTTPVVLRDLIIELGAHHRNTGGAILQAAMAPAPQPQQAQPQQGRGQGQGQGQAQPAQTQGQGRGQGQQPGAGTGRGRGSSGQQ